MRKACVLIDETSLMDDGVNCDVEPPRHGCGLSAIIEGEPERPYLWTCVYVLFDGFGARLDADFDTGEHLNLRLPAEWRRRLPKSFRSRFGKTVLMKKWHLKSPTRMRLGRRQRSQSGADRSAGCTAP